MKVVALFLGFLISVSALMGQTTSPEYRDLVRKADALYRAKHYEQAASTFSSAFKANNWQADLNDRYNAACSWALANHPDSAFFQLNYIATQMSYSSYGHITNDSDLKSLYSDKRWSTLLETVRINRAKVEADLFMEVNGKKMEVFTTGMVNNQKGKPVVVFENGMATRYIWWEAVMNAVAEKSSVFAYNRPRVGESEDDSLPPTLKHIVDNLRQMLLKKGLNPPYLLVGHSFGGAYIRSFASYYPNEIAGLIFVDPIDFTKKNEYASMPYLEIGITQHQIDSLFGETYSKFIEKLYAEMPKVYVEEVKISREISATDFEECTRNPLPDVPVHFIKAGAYQRDENEKPTIYDREKMFRINNNIQMKRWLELINPLKYGRLFYSSSSGHFVQKDDPAIIISSIRLALDDYARIQKE